MKNPLLFLLIISLSIFSSCSNTQNKQVETSTESCPCNFVRTYLPCNSYERPGKDDMIILFSYYHIDLAKKNADSIITISVSEKTNLDSLFLVLDTHRENLLKDSLENEKWLGISMKIPQMPLSIFTKIWCNFYVKNLMCPVYLDLRYDEIIVFFSNKNDEADYYSNKLKLYHDLSEKEYAEYLKNADYDALKRVEDLTKFARHAPWYIFRTSPLKDTVKYLSQLDTAINFYWDNKRVQLDSLEHAISDFKNKFQPEFHKIQIIDTVQENCKRNVFSIHFAKNIPFTEFMQIFDVAWKYGLVYDIDCVENKLNLYTLCDEFESRKFYPTRSMW